MVHALLQIMLNHMKYIKVQCSGGSTGEGGGAPGARPPHGPKFS